MEEVDGIIIRSLKSIGGEFEEDVFSLREFTTELIYSSMLLCVEACRGGGEKDLPRTLPGGMSQRFRVGTALATQVAELGYTGEIGYQTLLYSNEAEIRKVFMFLVEKLPREAAGQTQDTEGGVGAQLSRSIAQSVVERLKGTWAPPHCLKNGLSWRGKQAQWCLEGVNGCRKFDSTLLLSPPPSVGDLSQKISPDHKLYYEKTLPYIHRQTRSSPQLLASLLAMNASQLVVQQEEQLQGHRSKLSREEHRAKKLERLRKKIQDGDLQMTSAPDLDFGGRSGESKVKGSAESNVKDAKKAPAISSRFTHTERLQFTETPPTKEEKVTKSEAAAPENEKTSEEDLKQQREQELEALNTALAKVTRKLDRVESDMKNFTEETTQMKDQLKDEESTKEKQEVDLSVKKKTIDLLPDSAANIAKLKGVVEASNQRLASLAAQWDKHRIPMEQKIEALKGSSSRSEEKIARKLEEIKMFRQRMKATSDDARGKDELHRQLVAEFEVMTKDLSRSSYTKRILEIVANIKKQKRDIDKVLADTKTLQKEINQLTGKLDRTFTVTDELIFKDAKKDEGVKKAYKYLASLHESCSQLIKTVEDTGVIMREIRELEDQIEQQDQQKVLDNLEKLLGDLKMMKRENAEMVAQVKKQMS